MCEKSRVEIAMYLLLSFIEALVQTKSLPIIISLNPADSFFLLRDLHAWLVKFN